MLFNTLAAIWAGIKRFVLASSHCRTAGTPALHETPDPERRSLKTIAVRHALSALRSDAKRVMEMMALDYGMPMKSWISPRRARSSTQMETRSCGFPRNVATLHLDTAMSNLVHALAKG